MTRGLRASEQEKRAKARRQSALKRVELGQESAPRVSAAGPTSMAIKARDASDDLLVEAYLRQKETQR